MAQYVPVIQLIGPSGYHDAGTFLAGLEKHIARLRRGQPEIRVHRPRLRNAAELAQALRNHAGLTIVSGHGGCNDEDAWISDGSTDPENWLYFSQFSRLAPGKIATRGGMVWDVCTAGKPGFRTALEPHLGHEVTHVGVIGSVVYKDTVVIVPAILRTLLAPRTPVINPRHDRRCGSSRQEGHGTPALPHPARLRTDSGQRTNPSQPRGRRQRTVQHANTGITRGMIRDGVVA